MGEAVSEQKGEKASSYELECLVDVQMEAHIPESYIENLNQRLDIYRRISDIRSEEDASDVLDELIDRFGEPPASVKGLVDVALLRNTAASLGIYEIAAKRRASLPAQDRHEAGRRARFRYEGARDGGRAGAKPYLSVRLSRGTPPLDALREVLTLARQSVSTTTF